MSLRSTFRAPSNAALVALESALSNFRISQAASPAAKRHASHQAQGRANGAKQGPGKRLGGKKMAGEYVVTGNIIFKQRGTHWFPGDNCFMGRDHTIHAGAPGYVTYYKDPARHPDRKFIGIVFDRDQKLPQAPYAPRRRRLGMLAYQSRDTALESDSENFSPEDVLDVSTPAPATRDTPQDSRSVIVRRGKKGAMQERIMNLRPGYMYRQANWQIAQTALDSKTAKSALPYKPHDRFAAWRKSALRKAKNAERRAMGRGGKKK